jgi:uncharacterized protein HemX
MKSMPKSREPRSPKPKLPSEIEEQIRTRAHELYEQRGRVEGSAQEDWLRAEAEILARIKASKTKGAKRSK